MFSKIHIELSSVCHKNCWMCGRRQRDIMIGDQEYGYMPLDMIHKISKQIPSNTLTAFHWNGDPLHYPHLGDAIHMFKHCITYFVTNGLLLMKKHNEIIGNIDIISISIIENEIPSVRIQQLSTIKNFLSYKGKNKPHVLLRFVGNITNKSDYTELELPIVSRTLHNPESSTNYKKPVIIPEHGICLDLLHGLAIDRYGNISLCVRYDPDGELRLGHINNMSLEQAWTSEKRIKILNYHISGLRHMSGYCGNKCDFYGCPVGGDI